MEGQLLGLKSVILVKLVRVRTRLWASIKLATTKKNQCDNPCHLHFNLFIALFQQLHCMGWLNYRLDKIQISHFREACTCDTVSAGTGTPPLCGPGSLSKWVSEVGLTPMLQRPQRLLLQLKQRTRAVVAKVPMWKNKGGELASKTGWKAAFKKKINKANFCPAVRHGPGLLEPLIISWLIMKLGLKQWIRHSSKKIKNKK